MELAKVNTICMTNSPFDALETPKWDAGFDRDERFTSALRIDPLLLEWDSVGPQLAASGYEVQADLSGKTMEEVAVFAGLGQAHGRTVRDGLPAADVRVPGRHAMFEIDRRRDPAVLPREGLAFALMIGVKRGVNVRRCNWPATASASPA